MRLRIDLRDDLVAELDRRAGPRGRAAFVARAVERALEDERRWDLIESAVSSIGNGHEWDADVATWVRDQRQSDTRRVG